MKFRLYLAVFILAFWPFHARAAAGQQSSSLVGSGKSFTIDSNPDMRNSPHVDLGTIKQIGGEFEAVISWSFVTPKQKQAHPDLPDDAQIFERDRIECQPNRVFYYTIEEGIQTPDGKILDSQKLDPAKKRQEATGDPLLVDDSYHPNPSSLVCWAAARKCEGKPLSWPPPPMAYSDNGKLMTQILNDWNKLFVPSCRL